jgi:CO dehydrogenase maturation factor
VPGRLIAFSGKGGAGKTTLAALALRRLVATGRRPVLAVDADPNATLAVTLGVEIHETIADLRDRMGRAAQSVSEIPKQRLMDQWLAELLTESAGFDLLTMGRPEGPKCYCYVNALLKRYLQELRANYPIVLVDCEAGMEYLSRLTVGDIDALVLVAEATRIGLTSAARIAELADALPMQVRRRVLAVNKVGQPGPAAGGLEGPEPLDVDATVRVPFDADLYEHCARGEPIGAVAARPIAPAIETLVGLCVEAPGHRVQNTR